MISCGSRPSTRALLAHMPLKGVDFSVRSGEAHCLIGENGSGKSTLIKIISGVEQPNSGEVWVNGALAAARHGGRDDQAGNSGHLPGPFAAAEPDRGREHRDCAAGQVGAPAGELAQGPRDCPRGDGAHSGRPRSRRHRWRTAHRAATDGRHLPGVHRRPTASGAGRADRVAHQGRDRPPYRRRARHAGARHRHPFRQPQAQRGHRRGRPCNCVARRFDGGHAVAGAAQHRQACRDDDRQASRADAVPLCRRAQKEVAGSAQPIQAKQLRGHFVRSL